MTFIDQSRDVKPSNYLETDNPRVLAARYRWDVKGHADMAAELAARAAEMAKPAKREPEPIGSTMSDEAYAELVKATDSATRTVDATFTGPAHARAWIVRRMVSHGECFRHAWWLYYGSQGAGGGGCDCAPCTDARNPGRAEARKALVAKRVAARKARTTSKPEATIHDCNNAETCWC